MQQFFKFRIASQLLEGAPILLAGFRLELGANGGQIHRTLVQLGFYGWLVVLVPHVEVFVLFALAHTVH